MRIRRGMAKRRARLAMIAAGGLAASTIAGVVAGTSTVGRIDPVYHGYTSSQRPWRPLSASGDAFTLDAPVATYAALPPFGSRSDPAFAPLAELATYKPEPWERDLESDYRRWQARVDAEIRNAQVRVVRESGEIERDTARASEP